MEKKTAAVIIAAAALISSVVVSQFYADCTLQLRAVGVLAACLILWISEALPISISSLLIISLLPFLGLMDFGDVISNFGVNTALFIMASSGITIALSTGAVPKCLTNFLMKKCGGHPIMLVIGVSVTVALFSAFVSSLATCALFTALIVSALKSSGIKPGQTNLGKALMLTVPACAGIGGFMSPAGTPANILVIDILAQQGIEVTFLKWCAVGFTVGVPTVLLFALTVILVFRPEKNTEPITYSEVRFSSKDVATLVIVIAVIAGWVLTSFCTAINTTMVAVIGLGVMFLPPFRLLDMPKFSRGVNWDLVLAMGSVSILMTAVSNTGLLSDISGALFSNITTLSPLLVMMIISLVISVLRAFIPTTTAVIALFAPMLISISETTGLSVSALLMTASFWAATALLLIHTEPIYLISYKEGYFREADLLRVGVVSSLVLSAAATAGIYYLTLMTGLQA
ncbi:SLC13 family permease [Ruminococcus sp.]|uniref:SLC13 family permease n=1 Tax=Ruminococcus sp. TaxID=41978 RepID=UPI002E765F62|nr:SLC13 family permease [Ruminococcus sp.]MEE1262113.1 SLC13 family permease [Ruminococcus sp.]